MGGHLLKRLLLTPLLIIALGALGAGLASADQIQIHFSGYGYEEGGFDFSYAGDEIHLMAIVTSVTFNNPDFPYYPADNEYTVCVTGLTSNGEVVDDYGQSTVIYNLGMLEIYEDPSFNANYDDCPDVDNPPEVFCDGTLWVGGPFVDFMINVWRDYGTGSFEGHINLDVGSAISYFDNEAYFFGGTLIPPHDPGIPECYDLSIDGQIHVDEVATANSSWSKVKSLY
jgi:hypothetical protein